MKKFTADLIITNDSFKIDSIIPPNSVDFSVVIPPYVYLPNYSSESKEKNIPKNQRKIVNNTTCNYLDNIEVLLEKISKITTKNGLCCLIVSDDKDTKDRLIPIGLDIIWRLTDGKNAKWKILDKIVWVKSPRNSVESLHTMKDGVMVSFEDTPFSDIYILQKTTSDIEHQEIWERIENLRIPNDKKNELAQPFWFIEPFSEKNYKDRVPKELILRLIMLFSQENDVVLDPFSGNCITAIAAKTLNRSYVCIDKDSKKTKLGKNRIKDIS